MLDSLTVELSKKVEEMESELSEVGMAKEKIEVFLSKYKEHSEQASSRASYFEEHFRPEQERSSSLESELVTIRKRADSDSGHAQMLAERISELERVLGAASDKFNGNGESDSINTNFGNKYVGVRRILLPRTSKESKALTPACFPILPTSRI